MAAFVAVFGAAWAVLSPVATARVLDVSGSFEGDGHTFTYNVSGVEPGPEDQPFNHSGTVTDTKATLSGSASFTIGDGLVTNLGMNAAISVGDQSAQESWPPEGVDGRVGGTTITFPFDLTVEVPPPPEQDPDDLAFGTTTEPEEPVPYATLSFSVSSRNCNDSGVCGGPQASGSFLVFATDRPSSPTVDWIAVAGALGAAAAAAAAAAGGFGKDPDADPDRWRYVLQVAASQVTVDVRGGGQLGAEAWAVNATGAVSPAADAVLTAAVTGPFTIAPASGQGSLHTSVTTTGPPGATGSVVITAAAGPTQMSSTVALRAEGTYRLELVPVTELVLRPDPASGRYTEALVDVRVVTDSAAGPTPVPADVTGAQGTPEDLVSLAQEPAPGPAPAVRLHVGLAADPSELAEADQRSVTIDVWAQASGVPDAEVLTGSVVIALEPLTASIHWMQAGHPETTDQVLEVTAEEAAELDLEVWLEGADGAEPPDAEFSHMANEDLAGTQLAPTVADFSCHPESRPWQKPDADRRARSRWRVNRSLPCAERPDLVPPVDTAIRVRAWKAGTITRREEAIDATEGRLAQALVPIQLAPVRLVAELVEPTEPIPADGQEHPVKIRVRRERDDRVHVGPVAVAVVPVEGRPASTVTPDRLQLAEPDAGELTLSLTPPELTYRSDGRYTETLRLTVPAQQGEGTPIGDVVVALAPAVALTLTSLKKGLVWEEPVTIERPAADRVRALTGQLRATAKQSQEPGHERTLVVNLAEVDLVAPPDEVESPTDRARTDEQGRFELTLPGLKPVPEQAPLELDLDALPPGALAADVAERLDLYERRMNSRVERARCPLATLVGDANADTLGSWRIETLGKLAAEDEDRYDDILGAIELSEAAGVYADAFSIVHYDLMRQSRDALAKLLADALSLTFTLTGTGQKLADLIGPAIRQLLGALDSYLVNPTVRLLRSTLRGIVHLVDAILDLIPQPGAQLQELANAVKAAWDEIAAATNAEQILVGAVELIVNGVMYIGRAIHALVVRAIRSLLPVTDTIMQQLCPALGPHLGPGWSKICEDTLKKIVDELEVIGLTVGGGTAAIGRILDVYPWLMTDAVSSVLGDLDALRVPADPAARRDRVGDGYSEISRMTFDHQQAYAAAEEYLAWFNLIATFVQIIMIAWGAVKRLLEEALKKLGKQLDAIDIVSAVSGGLVHAAEMLVSFGMGLGVAVGASESVEGLT
jgi:hypothetical protein